MQLPPPLRLDPATLRPRHTPGKIPFWIDAIVMLEPPLSAEEQPCAASCLPRKLRLDRHILLYEHFCVGLLS
jgi:hypothetical protein